MKKLLIASMCLGFVFAGSIANAEVFPGTSGDDCYWGTWLGDNIYGLEGQDRLSGWGGPDYIDGGTGYDYCGGGLGSDTIVNCEETRTESYYFCSDQSTSATSLETTDTAGYDTVIANENLAIVEASGTGTVVVLFPTAYENTSIAEKSGSEIEIIKANGDKSLDAIISSLSYDRVKELIQTEALTKEGVSYEVPVRALSKSEAKDIAKKLFKQANNNIEMLNPYDASKKIILTNVTYIGFKNTPLIPVFAE